MYLAKRYFSAVLVRAAPLLLCLSSKKFPELLLRDFHFLRGILRFPLLIVTYSNSDSDNLPDDCRGGGVGAPSRHPDSHLGIVWIGLLVFFVS